MSDDLRAFILEREADARAARESLDALLELLRACPPDRPLTAGNVARLLEIVSAYFTNVVDGVLPPEGVYLHA